MNNPAYDSGYLNSAKLSGRYLFKLIARNCSDWFGIIYKYMNFCLLVHVFARQHFLLAF